MGLVCHDLACTCCLRCQAFAYGSDEDEEDEDPWEPTKNFLRTIIVIMLK